MKSIFIILFFSLAIFIGLSIIPQQANSQINPCWKLVCPHDPANGFFNPDSVYVDTCQSTDFYKHTYFKKGIDVKFSEAYNMNLPQYNPDTTIFLDPNNIDSSYTDLIYTLKKIDALLGHFKIKKKYPECIDKSFFATNIYQIEFDNYVEYYSLQDTFYIYFGSHPESFRYLGLSNMPNINGKYPEWKMLIKDIGAPFDVNPDSVYWDVNQMKSDQLDTSYVYNEGYHYAKQWWEFKTSDTIHTYNQKDTFFLSDIDTVKSQSAYKYIKYLEKERGKVKIILVDSDINLYTISFDKYHKRSFSLLYPCPFMNYNQVFYIQRYQQGITSVESNVIPENLSIQDNQNNGILEINVKLKSTEHTIINIYDINSNLIQQLYNGIMQEGTNKISFNSNSLSHGLYFIVLSDGKNTITKKFIK